MRDIKVRAWVEDVMIYSHEGGIENLSWFFSWISPDSDYIMQYTGLKDKNGKEIYEGDILIDHEDYCMVKVEWNQSYSGYFFDYTDGYFGGDDLPLCAERCKIVGNIYENPELLKEKA